jgi:hypothetical protein
MVQLGLRYLLLNCVEHTLDVQVHDLAECILGVLIKPSAPRSSRIRKQNINVIGVLRYLLDQSFNLGNLGAIRGDGYGNCAGSEVGEGIENCTRLFACLRLAGRYEDLGAARLEQSSRVKN